MLVTKLDWQNHTPKGGHTEDEIGHAAVDDSPLCGQ